jgi:hypothetical protein
MVVFCFHAAHADAATRNVERTQTSIGVPKAVVMIAQASWGQQSGDDDTAAAIISAGTAIDEAFANNDKEAIRALLIPGHISVTPYYDGPQSVEDQIASVSDFADYTQTIVGEPSLQMLSSDVGVKSFIADLTGSFKGTPLPARVFVGQIMVKRDGKWIGGFYQVTTLKP